MISQRNPSRIENSPDQNLNRMTHMFTDFLLLYSESLDSISTIQRMSPGVKIIFWDLGLDNISVGKVC